ncbi:MAG: hypothetical protein ABIQ31_20415 [Ferruginibacter sp.]
MKKIITILFIAVAISGSLLAQEIKTTGTRKFMQVNTVESVVNGGLGRSKMIITNPDGSQKESDMENLFSLVGINFKNIKSNEGQVLKTLKTYTDDGWKLDQVTSFTLSPADGGGMGIFMTRYLLSKPEQQTLN